ncbi:hypothetical protein [Neobacillus vireti]|uniref:UPF0738 family protein n=1 Tax=Neobacillus vireti TaxID=220686 RepID=UPI002FFF512B
MKKRISIQKASITDNKLLLQASESINGFMPSEQILVDSKQFSFVYLLENQDGYTYLDIPESIWPFIKNSLEMTTPVWVQFKDDELELTNFYEELVFLINNIKGNSNYGEEMVAKVEAIF